VRIQAAIEDRILRVQAGLKEAKPVQDQPLELRRRAQDMIELHDTASASYLKRFYNIDWSDSALYHMVLNTSWLAVELAVELVVQAARKLEPAPA
jgi:cytidylate kinase